LQLAVTQRSRLLSWNLTVNLSSARSGFLFEERHKDMVFGFREGFSTLQNNFSGVCAYLFFSKKLF